MRRWLGFQVGLILALVSLGLPQTVRGEASLQVSPQKYEETLIGDRVRNGFVDVSNPTDVGVTIQSYVEGFKQADLDGNLAFFKDPALSAAIKPGLERFDLGPRQAIRVTFTVDPAKLPKGGVYAALFFQTVPPKQTSSISYIAESAKVGTLLILQNGAAGTHTGTVQKLQMPFWQVGSALRGQAVYANTNRDIEAVAFTPQLKLRATPWGKPSNVTGPLILPQASRAFEVVQKGSYFGLMPVTLSDPASGQAKTVWIFAMTGWFAYVVPLLILLIVIDVVLMLVRKRQRRKPKSSARPLDGLSPKPKK